MGKKAVTKWTLVQHSGFGYSRKPEFQKAVELRQIEGKDIERVEKARGVVFDSYGDAAASEDLENYPPNTVGICPNVRGTFHAKIQIDGLAVYLPDPKLGLVRFEEIRS